MVKALDKRRKGCKAWLKALCVGLLVVGVAMIGAGALYQATASASDRRGYPPPGELVMVDGRQYHLVCAGTGKPAVVLEAGLNHTWLHWDVIQGEIAAFTKVCAYDRAGLGWSEAADSPLLTAQVAASLSAVLKAADIPGPYVLVGHSIGGVHVRSFARQFPDRVAGIVLIDSSHESQNLRLPEEMVVTTSSVARFICRFLTPLGFNRLLKLNELNTEDLPLDVGQRKVLIATMNQTHSCRAQLNESEATETDLAQDDLPDSLGYVPLVVITQGIGVSDTESELLPAGATADVLRRQDEVWMKLQSELAALSSHSQHIMALESGHYIHRDQPKLVIDAIRAIVESVRQ